MCLGHLTINWRLLGDFGDSLAIKKGEVSLLFIPGKSKKVHKFKIWAMRVIDSSMNALREHYPLDNLWPYFENRTLKKPIMKALCPGAVTDI